MSEQPWLKQPNEPLLWWKRFEKFRQMEPIHSIPEVFRAEEATRKREKRRTDPPGDWYAQAKKWQWEERAAAWDAFADAQIEKEIAAERKKILRSEYALMHKRVQLLNRKIKQLEAITDTDDKIWLDDVKSVGYGPDAERVDLKVFNADAFKELREYVDDVAAEMGERVKKSEVSAKVHSTGRIGVYLPQKYNLLDERSSEERRTPATDDEQHSSDDRSAATTE